MRRLYTVRWPLYFYLQCVQYDRWQQAGDISENPKNLYGNTSNSNAASTRRLYDGDFMRLRDVTIGYNFPKSPIPALAKFVATLVE